MPAIVLSYDYHLFPGNVDHLDFEVDANGGQIRGHESIIAKPQKNVDLVDAAFAVMNNLAR